MKKRLGVLICAVVAAACVALPSGTATAAANTCNGGSVAPGTYDSLTIAGFCTVDAGSVTVKHNLKVLPNAGLAAAFGGSDLTVGGNLDAQANSVLVLGCYPGEFICFNDPDQENGTLSSHESVGGNLTADNALAVLLHNDTFSHNLTLAGGGGGLDCDQPNLFGGPAYGTVEDTQIGGNATIVGWQTCWLGFFRNTVAHNVTYNGNVTGDPDGNEVQTNTIGGNLDCSGNSPKPQEGDSGGSPNTVAGNKTGQCKDL
jgi:hypothetical protein